MNNLELLRKFEPILHFTAGELFLPCAVDGYLHRCSLWLRDGRGRERQLVAEGQLSPERLAQYREVPAGQTLYLRFVKKPLEPLEYQRWLNRPYRHVFQAPGRLTRVGLISRILDSFFNLSLLVRGTVPGGTMAAAEQKYRKIYRADRRYVYYGRVVKDGGYIILQYLFFYPMNNWRSGFYGVNDHEADWEQIFVYLSEEQAGDPSPRWVAYASHENAGDALRRRWDDPELQRVGTHPVVFTGAGSHASYFLPGEYIMAIEPEFLRPLKNGLILLRKLWVEKLGQGDSNQVDEQVRALLSIPFVDYARGDGVSIGPGQKQRWSPILLTEGADWVEHYRGLWGLDTRDPLGGERAPAGPKFNRDGSVRVSWYDPLGWAGLDKVPPPGQVISRLQQHIEQLVQEQEAVKQEIVEKREAVRLLALEVQALHETEYLNHLHQAQHKRLEDAQTELQELFAHATMLRETRLASQAYLQKIEGGDWGDPQAHIEHKQAPEPPIGQQARFTELWAAVSGGLLLLAFTLLLLLSPARWLTWAVLVVGFFITIEAIVRKQLAKLLINLTIFLAVVTGLILIKEFWWLLVIGALFGLVITILTENLRELWTS